MAVAPALMFILLGLSPRSPRRAGRRSMDTTCACRGWVDRLSAGKFRRGNRRSRFVSALLHTIGFAAPGAARVSAALALLITPPCAVSGDSSGRSPPVPHSNRGRAGLAVRVRSGASSRPLQTWGLVEDLDWFSIRSPRGCPLASLTSGRRHRLWPSCSWQVFKRSTRHSTRRHGWMVPAVCAGSSHTLLLLRPALVVAAAFRMLDARASSIWHAMTGGGPGTATEPLSFMRSSV